MPQGSQFSDDQLEELRSLGVSERQLQGLEHVCRTCRHEMPPLHPLNDTRSELTSLATSLRAAKASIERLNDAPGTGQRTPLWEAWSWISGSHRWKAFEGRGLPEVDLGGTERRLSEILAVTDALLSLPVEPRRRRVSTRPGFYVDLTLKDGWLEARPWDYQKASAVGLLTNPSDPYPFRPSISPTSPYFMVMAVFIEALTGHKGSSPERYVRAYLRWLTLNDWRPLGMIPGNR